MNSLLFKNIVIWPYNLDQKIITYGETEKNFEKIFLYFFPTPKVMFFVLPWIKIIKYELRDKNGQRSILGRPS